MEGWTFDIDDEKRRAALLVPTTFEEIVGRIERDSTILCCHRQESDDAKPTIFSRLVYMLQIHRDLFDVFFNSSHGYRGAYYRSPYSGLEANAFFMRALMPKLRAWSFIEASLASLSAKVWLAECSKEIIRNCPGCAGEWSDTRVDGPTDIRNDRWECPVPSSSMGKWGRTAPRHTKLRVFGAFLNERHDEFIPAPKRRRANDIFQCGWS
jgi:hypothetical protein